MPDNVHLTEGVSAEKYLKEGTEDSSDSMDSPFSMTRL